MASVGRKSRRRSKSERDSRDLIGSLKRRKKDNRTNVTDIQFCRSNTDDNLSSDTSEKEGKDKTDEPELKSSKKGSPRRVEEQKGGKKSSPRRLEKSEDLKSSKKGSPRRLEKSEELEGSSHTVKEHEQEKQEKKERSKSKSGINYVLQSKAKLKQMKSQNRVQRSETVSALFRHDKQQEEEGDPRKLRRRVSELDSVTNAVKRSAALARRSIVEPKRTPPSPPAEKSDSPTQLTRSEELMNGLRSDTISSGSKPAFGHRRSGSVREDEFRRETGVFERSGSYRLNLERVKEKSKPRWGSISGRKKRSPHGVEVSLPTNITNSNMFKPRETLEEDLARIQIENEELKKFLKEEKTQKEELRLQNRSLQNELKLCKLRIETLNERLISFNGLSASLMKQAQELEEENRLLKKKEKTIAWLKKKEEEKEEEKEKTRGHESGEYNHKVIRFTGLKGEDCKPKKPPEIPPKPDIPIVIPSRSMILPSPPAPPSIRANRAQTMYSVSGGGENFSQLVTKQHRRLSTMLVHRKISPASGDNIISLHINEEKRNCVAQEILSTERTYVKCLEIIINQFYKPLLEMVLNDITGKWEITEQQIRTIFYQIETIYQFNTLLLHSLNERLGNWSQHSLLGDVFLDMGDYMRIYRSYIINYANALSTLQECRKNKKFQDFLDTVHSRDDSITAFFGHRINSYLITPVQRIPRYINLLKSLQHYTPKEHKDYKLIGEAINKIEQVADGNEKSHEASVNIAKLCKVQRVLYQPRGELQIVEPHRKFLFEGTVTFIGMDHHYCCLEKPTFGHIFLFSDIIVFAKLKKVKKTKHSSLSNEPIQEESVDGGLNDSSLIYLCHFIIGKCKVRKMKDKENGMVVSHKKEFAKFTVNSKKKFKEYASAVMSAIKENKKLMASREKVKKGVSKTTSADTLHSPRSQLNNTKDEGSSNNNKHSLKSPRRKHTS
eukprot:CAMPEP_0174253766 /NCGR_PEP_ID=MMETSP0439-20130205/3115_1 /TAXON_ID=0 /ORGANISM="Stereomyxa ramosa, Strain Chinc5" /LENGTH=950 /DNA_ID=CAMNT_0015334963 /DNA_START=126 /DNA_END=2978 /DNA_ORIENTATION=-